MTVTRKQLEDVGVDYQMVAYEGKYGTRYVGKPQRLSRNGWARGDGWFSKRAKDYPLEFSGGIHCDGPHDISNTARESRADQCSYCQMNHPHTDQLHFREVENHLNALPALRENCE